MHHTEGHNPTLSNYKYKSKCWCQRALHEGACPHRTSGWSAVASSSGAHSHLWRATPWLFKGTSLPTQYEHLCHGDTSQNSGWSGNPCQPGTTGGPPNQDCQRDYYKSTQRLGLGGFRPPGPKEWPESEQKQARELLLKWEHLFAHSDLDLGKTALIKHKIRLTEQTPFKERYRCIPPHMYDDVRAHIQEMLDIGAICKSHSLWGSAVVLVQKKDGGLRFCIDLRKLNEQTIKDAYSLPRIDETLDSLQGSQWFSSLNLKSGYWQVEMDEESKPLTAFTVGLLGFYECKRMPFRLTNAPATFQRLMETCLGDLNLHWCIIYLDDIVIFSKDLASHLERLKAVFWKLEEAGLKLKPSKCKLFWRQLAYLGHVISAKGVATDESKIEAIKNWPTPTNITEVQSFLGFMGYYCRFIPKFVQVARPLHELTSGENVGKKKAAIQVGQQVSTGL